MPTLIDLVGQQFGFLTVEKLIQRNPSKWQCLCKCGIRKTFFAGNLRAGYSTSCGCYHRQVVSIHGQWKTQTYSSWQHMIDRCTNPNHDSYPHYGGRGIKVTEAWRDFREFWADMGDCPPSGSIERGDVDGDYCKENCTWIPSKDQRKNTRRTLLVCIDGVDMCMKDACTKKGLTAGQYRAVIARMSRGRSAQEAFDSYIARLGKPRRIYTSKITVSSTASP
jgi:hypothetical protein